MTRKRQRVREADHPTDAILAADRPSWWHSRVRLQGITILVMLGHMEARDTDALLTLLKGI